MSSFICPRCHRCASSVRSLSQHVARSHRHEQQALLIEAYSQRCGEDDCWAWLGTRSRSGYACLVIHRRQIRVSRLLIAVTSDQEACHRCDNPSCVNTRHLFAATSAENQHDKTRKGRQARGEKNGGGGRLTERDVHAIRRALSEHESKRSIARRFNVSATEIYFIEREQHWSHV